MAASVLLVFLVRGTWFFVLKWVEEFFISPLTATRMLSGFSLSGLLRKYSANRRVGAVVVVVVLSLVLGAAAGSLTPPGAPASTMHSLSEVYASIASAAFDSSAITANQNGSLIAQLKYLNN
ncbi:MAG: hypothetical protein IT406_04240, partial [Candidatus Yanofskybacteria bacterium]|nr:hypothetical protein [Candidatus Yanofskybacteria bacterium]